MVVPAWFVRHVTYPLWQQRRGGAVLSALAELQRTQWLSPAQLESLRLARLRRVIDHAVRCSSLYRQRFLDAGVSADRVQSLEDLARLPVLEKADLRDRGSEVRTAATTEGLVLRRTGGSTGIPLALWATPAARDAWTAASLRFMQWWGVAIGDPRLTLISRRTLTRVGWVKQYLGANVLEHSAKDLSPRTLEKIYRRLTAGGIAALMGYPSSLTYLADYVRSRGGLRRSSLRAVFTTGEVLHADQRALLEEVFTCPVADEYGSSETGHIAGECPRGSLHIAAEQLIVEVEGSGGRVGVEGELLVTDLLNLATPLIRYRIGDRGALGSPCPCGRGLPVLAIRVARTSDLVVLPDGRRLDFSAVDDVLDDLVLAGFPLHQYRVVQHALDAFEILLATPAPLSRDVEDDLRRRLRMALNYPVHVDVRRVAEIPPDGTGKRRRFVSRLHERHRTA